MEVRSLETLQLQRELDLPIEGITSASLDSQGWLWMISNPMRGGDGGLYVLQGPASVERVRQYSIPTSLDSMRITPWGRKLLVADYGRHTVECISNGRGAPGRGQLYINGELVGNTEFPTTVPLTFGIEGLSCGYDFGEAVTHEYHAPFTFTGLIKKVTVDISGELIEDNESKVRMIMARQ